MAKTIEQIQTLITNSHDAREVINEIADYLQANPIGGNDSNAFSIQTASKTFTEAEIKAPPFENPYWEEWIPAPPAGKKTLILSYSLSLNLVQYYTQGLVGGNIVLNGGPSFGGGIEESGISINFGNFEEIFISPAAGGYDTPSNRIFIVIPWYGSIYGGDGSENDWTFRAGQLSTYPLWLRIRAIILVGGDPANTFTFNLIYAYVPA